MKLAVPDCGTVAIIGSDFRYVLRCPSMVRPMRPQSGHLLGVVSVLQKRL